jgi:putative ABC transport system ATP-binding protein
VLYRCLKKIATEQNVAIIMVTHDERMVQRCDKIMKIKNKKIVFETVDVPS